MKYCSQCAREFPDSSLFCTQCGIPLTARPVPAAEPVPVAMENPSPAAEPVPVAAENPSPAAEPVPAAEKPVDVAADAIMPDELTEPAAVPPTQESPSAPAAKEELSAIVGAAPATIEIDLAAPKAPAAYDVVAVATAPAQPPVVVPPQEMTTPLEMPEASAPVTPPWAQEVPAPPEETRAGGEKISVIRKIGAFFLCIPLFLFLLIPAIIYQARDASTERWLSNYLEKIPPSDWAGSEGIGDTIEDWLRGLAPELEDLEYDPSDETSDIERLVDSAEVKGFVAERLAAYLDDLYSGASGIAFEVEDISDLMDEHREAINEQLSDMVDDLLGSRSGIEIRTTRPYRNDLAKRLIGLLEDSGAYDYLDTDTMKEETPVVYYGLRYGLSYITGGVSLLLAVLMFICLIKTLKSGLRATNRAGIVLIVLGGALALLALFPKLLGDVWLGLFNDAHILALFAEEFFYTHILVDLGILGAGILLTAATGLALGIRKKRAA